MSKTAQTPSSPRLDDKYTQTEGRVFLSGVQALVRLPILQAARDRAAGLKTAGFISGYRGSPMGMYDHALWRAQKYLRACDITFQPGLNEDLAVTSVWGSQQTGLFPGARVDGVFGIWYGKGPGVDRSADAFKHANSAGTSARGGVLAIAGDDHGAQSSTLAHQSEQIFAAAMMPVLNPASVQDYLDFGLLGFALSRFSGCWVGFKAIAETVESAASIMLDPLGVEIKIPTDFKPPVGGLNIRWPDAPLMQESRLHGPKMAAIAAFAGLNAFDRIIFDSPRPRLGIMATGKAYLDARQALHDLGIDAAAAAQLGLRLYKVGLSWPLEAHGALRFADGLQDILVIEEKRGFIEDQLTRLLYNLDAARRPRIVGKADESGAPLLPSAGELSPAMLARAIVGRLKRLGPVDPALDQRLARLESFEALERVPAMAATIRTPYFCSGCPHNASTKIPEGSRAMAGIGCHTMVLSMPMRRTHTLTHMGGEGANWIGLSPYIAAPHIFQNLGDGTYTHSGLLAIRAAAAAGVNITYKILYNDAVAMTGGQPVEGGFSVGEIAQQVAAEGAKAIAIVSDEPEKYPLHGYFPSQARVYHRRELDAVQRDLRERAGLTVLIYDQTCAAEKRRRRKRGLYPDPAKRAFIYDLVCEGCGDCSLASNCVSIKPLETEFGRKRQIDQSSCNKDFSCVDGFCPSFVTIHGGRLRAPQNQPMQTGGAAYADPPAPTIRPLTEPYGILVAGVGGAGVITIGAVLGMAAHIEGKGCSTLDFTGLSQKNGAVMSHVRIAPAPEDLAAVRIAAGGANLLLGCDINVAASPAALSRLERGASRAIINSDLQPTAAFVLNPDLDFAETPMRQKLGDAVGEDGLHLVAASRIAMALMGDSIAANNFMLGYAWQKGFIPLAEDSLLEAIALNGAAVEMNTRAFKWGRRAAHDMASLDAAMGARPQAEKPPQTLSQHILSRAAFLRDYQDDAWAERYLALCRATQEAEARSSKPSEAQSEALSRAVADNFFKLMSYKDEYEVARLYSSADFRAKLAEQFEGDYKLRFSLAPPILAPRDPNAQEPVKRSFGPSVMILFRLLARAKRLRGGRFDPFGRTEERRSERALIDEYEATIHEILRGLNADNLAQAVKIARVPQTIRGYGRVKQANIVKARAERERFLRAFRAAEASAAA